MKTKTITITIAAGLFCAAALTQAQSALVAGWDFSQFAFSGANSTNGSDFTGAGNAEANYSDLLSPSPGIDAAAFGSIYYDTSYGSSDVGAASFDATTAPASGNLSSANPQTADGNPFNDLGSYNILEFTGQNYTNDLRLGLTADSTFVIEADLSSVSLVGSDWTLQFAATNLAFGDSSSAFSWEVSANGVDFSSIGTTTTTDGLDKGYSVSGGATLDGSAMAYFRATVTGIDTQLLIDNVGVSAVTTAIPEPSMFAGLLGIFGLTFALRRRR